MNLESTIQAYGTSTGVQHAWDTRGRGRVSKKVSNALKSYVPMTKDKLRTATVNEAIVAKVLGGLHTTNNHEFDILLEKKKIGVEVKTVFPGVKNDKITMHPDSLERKEMFLKAEKYKKSFTVIFDMRDHSLYVAKGLGSFRFDRPGRVNKVNLKGLKSFILGE